MKAAAIIILSILGLCLVGLGFWLWTPDRSRAALEAKYLSSPTDMRDVAGVRMDVRDTGPRDAPAIIMIHGLGSSLHTWEDWARALEPEYRVIRFDMPGAGLSEPDPTGDYSDARVRFLLAALMDQLGVAKAVLVGNSIGGRIAWGFAARNPERVVKLVLISPDGFASPGFEYGRAPKVPAIAGIAKYVLPKVFVKMNLVPAYADPSKLGAATLDRYYDLLLAPGVRGALIDRMGQTVLDNPEPLLRQIKVPVLLVWGEKDALIPISNAADYQRDLPDVRLVPLPGLGHVPQEEAPAVSLMPVREFLAR